MNKAPRTVARIRSTGAFGDFPGAVLAAVEHDTYILESEAAAALSEARAEVERLREALTPFAFYSDEPNTTQDAWEIRYRDRFQDWIDFADIEAARAALEAKTPDTYTTE